MELSQEMKDGLAVLKLSEFVDRREYLEAFWRMEDKYPGRGWAEGAKELEAFYEGRKPVKPGQGQMSFGGMDFIRRPSLQRA
jgi:hypothetical protein